MPKRLTTTVGHVRKVGHFYFLLFVFQNKFFLSVSDRFTEPAMAAKVIGEVYMGFESSENNVGIVEVNETK